MIETRKKGYQGPKLAGDNAETRARLAKKNAGGRSTNAVFAAEDPDFKSACEKAGIPATPRQAGKYRGKRGLAWSSR